MYARLFTGFAERDKAEDFPVRFAELLLPGLSGKAGFKSLYIMKGAEEDKYVVLVLWDGEAPVDKAIEHYFQEQWPLITGLMLDPPTFETLEVVLRA